MLLIVAWPRRRRVGFAPMAAPVAALEGAEATVAFRLTEGVVAGALAGVMVAPVVIGVSVVLGWLSSARRWFGHLMAPALFALIGLFYVFRQIRGRPLPGFGWVQSFERAHNVALVAVIALVVHTIASEARDR